jgi:hypothetical protein
MLDILGLVFHYIELLYLKVVIIYVLFTVFYVFLTWYHDNKEKINYNKRWEKSDKKFDYWALLHRTYHQPSLYELKDGEWIPAWNQWVKNNELPNLNTFAYDFDIIDKIINKKMKKAGFDD